MEVAEEVQEVQEQPSVSSRENYSYTPFSEVRDKISGTLSVHTHLKTCK